MKKILLPSLLFILTSFVLSGLQATLYFFPIQVPLFWITVHAFYSFRKSLLFSLTLNIAHTLVIISFSTTPAGQILLTMNFFTIVFYFIRERFHTGLAHIALASAVSSFIFFSANWFLHAIQRNLYFPNLGSWISMALTSLILSYPLAFFLEKMDDKIQFETIDTLENLRI